MKNLDSLFSKKSFREVISKIFKKKSSKPKPIRVERDTTHLRKKWARQAAGRKYRFKCLRRYQKKMTARRRAKNKSATSFIETIMRGCHKVTVAAKSRRINRKRGCRPRADGYPWL